MATPDYPGDVPVVVEKRGNALGIASFVFGTISIFLFAPLLVPLALLLGLIGLIKRQFVWSLLGIVAATLGFLTSPILMGFFGAIGLGAGLLGLGIGLANLAPSAPVAPSPAAVAPPAPAAAPVAPAKPSPTYDLAVDDSAFRARVVTIRTFGCQPDSSPAPGASYTDTLAPSRGAYRHVCFEIGWSYPQPHRKIDFRVDAQWYSPGTSEPFTVSYTGFFLPDWETSTYRAGWQRGSDWPAGRYRVELYVRNQKIGSAAYDIAK
jgi:hypothetical protein